MIVRINEEWRIETDKRQAIVKKGRSPRAHLGSFAGIDGYLNRVNLTYGRSFWSDKSQMVRATSVADQMRGGDPMLGLGFWVSGDDGLGNWTLHRAGFSLYPLPQSVVGYYGSLRQCLYTALWKHFLTSDAKIELFDAVLWQDRAWTAICGSRYASKRHVKADSATIQASAAYSPPDLGAGSLASLYCSRSTVLPL